MSPGRLFPAGYYTPVGYLAAQPVRRHEQDAMAVIPACHAADGILWAAIYTEAAYLAGNALQRATGLIDWAFGIAITITIVLVLIRRQTSKLAVRAEAAYPGPLE